MCSTYNTKIWELLIPSVSYFNDLCLSYDKTSLFIVTCMRILIMWIIYNFLVEYFKNTSSEGTITLVMLVILGLNMISLSMVIMKKPSHKHDNLPAGK